MKPYVVAALRIAGCVLFLGVSATIAGAATSAPSVLGPPAISDPALQPLSLNLQGPMTLSLVTPKPLAVNVQGPMTLSVRGPGPVPTPGGTLIHPVLIPKGP